MSKKKKEKADEVGKSKAARAPRKTKVDAADGAARSSKRSSKGHSQDDIALRAYYIAEKRRHHGHHGDETSDWIEAERQLASETRSKRKNGS